MSGPTFTPAQIEFFRKMNLGRKHTKETKLKCRLARLGKKNSLETRRKISIGNSGKIQSEETRRKIGIANKGRNLGRKLGKVIQEHHIDLNRKNKNKDNLLYLRGNLHQALHLHAYRYLVLIGKVREYIEWFKKEQGIK